MYLLGVDVPFRGLMKKITHEFRTCVSAIFPWDGGKFLLEIHIFGGFFGGPGESLKGDDDDDDDDIDATFTKLTPQNSNSNNTVTPLEN